MAAAPTLIDLFAGCGGLTRGFVDAGFEPIFAVESEADPAGTYRSNFESHLAEAQIEDIQKFPEADVIVGGPPCQGFSSLNMAGVGLERRGLWSHYLQAIEQAEPRLFLMENVPQLLRSAEFDAFSRAAHRLGYTVDGQVLNAADFGVPQRRKRAFVMGVRDGEPSWPAPTHFPPESVPLEGLPWRTFREAVKGLSREPTGRNWHRARNPQPISLERYRTIPNEGEGRFELADRRPDITPPCWLGKTKGSTDVFGRLWWDRPAYTIRTEFFKPEKGRYLHPSEHRPITVREAARCMSFPDDFLFPETQSMTSVARQIGNAVPPLLARRIAESIAAVLEDRHLLSRAAA